MMEGLDDGACPSLLPVPLKDDVVVVVVEVTGAVVSFMLSVVLPFN